MLLLSRRGLLFVNLHYTFARRVKQGYYQSRCIWLFLEGGQTGHVLWFFGIPSHGACASVLIVTLATDALRAVLQVE